MSLLPHGYEMVIGLEIHAQVNTASKLFSGSPTEFGADPNTQTCPIDLGMPGVLPVLNTKAVDAAIQTGLALNAKINEVSVFARKNYFYPDLPKGYQTSQFEHPIVGLGNLTIDLEDGTTRDIGVTRLHLEEDAGKSVHDLGADNVSHVDLNRAGIPLMEIVSEPDMRTPEEASAYVKKLRAIVRALGVCDGNMEQGSLRCDANVSVRKIGVEKLGTRTEIKNLNSVRNIARAIQFEAERQIDVLEAGGSIDQETRLWDADKNITRTMRSKEDAHDYRYFPCPDLLPLRLDPARIAQLQKTLPELPDEMKQRFIESYGLSVYDASVLSSSREIASYYDEVIGGKRDAKTAANWVMGELFAALNKAGKDIQSSPVSAKQLGELLDLLGNKTISGKIAKTVFEDMFETGRDASVIVEEKGLVQITDASAIEAEAQAVIDENPKQTEAFRGGNDKLFGWFVGQVMKRTQGKANPAMVNQALKKLL